MYYHGCELTDEVLPVGWITNISWTILASLLQALFRWRMCNTLTAWCLQICGQKLEGLASAVELQTSGVAGGYRSIWVQRYLYICSMGTMDQVKRLRGWAGLLEGFWWAIISLDCTYKFCM